MSEKFELPGAERFAQYLESLVDGKLTAEGPERVKGIDDRADADQWLIRLNRQKQGIYLAFDQKLGEIEFERVYIGSIPGYINPKTETEEVILFYSNQIYRLTPEGQAMLVKTPWQRQDRQNQIPFP